MKKWTKTFAFAGQFIGMLLGANQENFYGLYVLDDLAMLVGYGIPFAIIGLLVGLVIDYFLKPKEEKEMEHINNPVKKYEPNKTTEVKNKSLNNRPRKRLGFKTPAEVFHQSLKRVALRT